MDTRNVSYFSHFSSHGVYLPHQLTLCGPSYGWITRHPSNSRFIHRHEECQTSHSNSRKGSLYSSVPSPNHNYVIFNVFWQNSLFHVKQTSIYLCKTLKICYLRPPRKYQHRLLRRNTKVLPSDQLKVDPQKHHFLPPEWQNRVNYLHFGEYSFVSY